MKKWVLYAGLAVLLVGAIGTGAYYLGLRQGENQGVAQSGPGKTHPLVPSGSPNSGIAAPPHPPVAGQAPQGSSEGKVIHYQVGNSNVKAILADGKTMWIGTSGGVIRYDSVSDQHRLFDVRSGLLSNGVFHLSKIDGQLVVGTYGGGLSLFDSATETWKNYNIQHGLADAFVYDVLKAKNGDIWVATWSGANRVRGGALNDRDMWDKFTVKNTQGGLPNDWVYGMREGRNGDIWLATEGGVALFRDGKWKNWKHAHGLGAPFKQVRDQIEFKRDPAKESSHHARQKIEQGLTGVDVAYNPNYIVSLEVDEDGTVWAGTWGAGLARFDGKTWRNYTMADGLPSSHIFMLRRDRAGNFWIGTSKGLALMKDGVFKVFKTSDGLFAENVFSLALSEKGDLWVGGFGGVTRFVGIPGK